MFVHAAGNGFNPRILLYVTSKEAVQSILQLLGSSLEADLKIRGPGDYIGSKQSGMNDISYEMINDNETLSDSRKWATRIVNSKRNLGTEYNNLREEFKKRGFDFTNIGIS